MTKLLKELPMRVYFGMREFFNDLKNDESGLSGVVVSVLLILVAVLAVAALWGLLGPWLTNTLWPQITGAASGIS